jgi:SAM-dependent methyltransferase
MTNGAINEHFHIEHQFTFLKLKLRLIFGSLDIGNWLRQKHLLSVIHNLHLDGKSILDAGCGGGASILYLAKRHLRGSFVGLDYDGRRIMEAELARNILAINNVVFRQEDLLKNLGENKYDLIYCVDVLEHISDDESVIENFFCALKSGGNLLIHSPLLSQRRFFSRFKNWTQADHIRGGYDLQSLVNMLKRHGFVVIYKKYTFGWAGALAWETYEICRCFGRIAQIGCFPALALVAPLDLRLRNQKGNAILILSKKQSNHAD